MDKIRLLTLKVFGYKPKLFWGIWGLNFHLSPQQCKIHNYDIAVYNLIEKLKPAAVLEIGCGFGKNLKELVKRGYSGDKLSGVDISSMMLKEARKNISNPQITLKKANLIKGLPFNNGNFELVYVSKILMHIPAEAFRKAALECIRVSRKHVIFCEQYQELPPAARTIAVEHNDFSEFTFIHNYKEYFAELGFEIKDFTVLNKNICIFRIYKNL